MLAGDLLDEIRADLASVEEAIRSARFVAALADGAVPEEGLRAIAGEQRRVVASDRRSFALLASRFASSPAHDWFVSMQQGESDALTLLDGYAGWLALDEDWFESYEPDPRAQAYPAFVAWLAVNGSVAAVAVAFLANLAAWGENCATVAAALRDAYGAGDAAVAYFEFFAAAPLAFRRTRLRSPRPDSTPATTPGKSGAPRVCCKPTSCSSGTHWPSTHRHTAPRRTTITALSLSENQRSCRHPRGALLARERGTRAVRRHECPVAC